MKAFSDERKKARFLKSLLYAIAQKIFRIIVLSGHFLEWQRQVEKLILPRVGVLREYETQRLDISTNTTGEISDLAGGETVTLPSAVCCKLYPNMEQKEKRINGVEVHL